MRYSAKWPVILSVTALQEISLHLSNGFPAIVIGLFPACANLLNLNMKVCGVSFTALIKSTPTYPCFKWSVLFTRSDPPPYSLVVRRIRLPAANRRSQKIRTPQHRTLPFKNEIASGKDPVNANALVFPAGRGTFQTISLFFYMPFFLFFFFLFPGTWGERLRYLCNSRCWAARCAITLLRRRHTCTGDIHVQLLQCTDKRDCGTLALSAPLRGEGVPGRKQTARRHPGSGGNAKMFFGFVDRVQHPSFLNVFFGVGRGLKKTTTH